MLSSCPPLILKGEKTTAFFYQIGGVIMKFAKLLINNIFIPILTTILFLVGLLAAFISALIEYSVFEQLYSSSFLRLLPAGVIAFALILSFEYTKVYLHYFLNRLKATGNETYLKKYKWLKAVKYILVVVSLTCSIIYSVSALYLASYNETEVEKQISEINAELDKNIEQVTAEQNENYNNKIKPYADAKQVATDAMSNFDPDELYWWQADMQLQALKDNLALAESTYNEKSAQFEKEKNTAIESEVSALTEEANKKISAISDTTSADVAAKYDNAILSQFLTVLASTFIGTTTYSRLAYLILTVLIGLIVSVILEIIISFTFTLLSDASNIQFCDPVSVDRKFQKWSEQLILAFIKAFFALTIYVIIVGLANNSSVSEDQFWIALFAYILAICMAKFFSSKNPEKNSGNNSIQMDFYVAAKESIIQGILSFAGFMLLGFVFGKEAVTLDISTIAIGLGATLSSLFGKLPEKMLTAIPCVK